MQTTWAFRRTVARALALGAGAALASLGGCGTATQDGMCKPAKNSGYSGASHDPNGTPWEISITPESYEGSCAEGGKIGYFRVVASILDGSKVPKPGLAVSGYLNSSSGEAFKLLGPADKPPSDTNTDSCGSALFHVQWICPPNAGDKHGGSLVISSGSLSKSIEVSIEHYIPDTSDE